MAIICKQSDTVTAANQIQSQTATGTGSFYISYSVTDNPDKAIISSSAVVSACLDSASHPQYANSCTARNVSSTSGWYVNGVQYLITDMSTTASSSTVGSTGTKTLASASTTISKTHSTQSIKVTTSFRLLTSISGILHNSSTKTCESTAYIQINPKKTYTVSFNANYGSGAPAAQTKWHGESLTLTTAKPTRTGYTFQGWAKTSTGSVAYASGSSFGIDADTTLYAVWKINTYAVNYYLRDSTATNCPAAQTKTYGTNLTLSNATPSLANYTFKGWATSTANSNAGTVNYAKGATYTGNAALNLYAVWERTYSKPTITSVKVARCAQDGGLVDDGDYAKVTFNWSVFRTSAARYYGGSTYPYSSNGVSSCTVTVGTRSTTVSLSGASGTGAYGIVGGVGAFDADKSYTATVSITDSQTIYSAHTTSASATLPPLFYPMDFNADATAVGFFMPAPDNGGGVYSGKDIHFFVDSNLSSGDDGTINQALAGLGWTSVLE